VTFLRHVSLLVMKDLRVEFRSREVLYTMTFFAAMVILVFSFAIDHKSVEVVPGILWVSILFSGTLGLSRALDRERESDTMRGLLLAPSSRTAIFVGKAIVIAALMFMVEIVITPLVMVFFDAPLFRFPFHLIALLILGTIGFAFIGTAFAAMLLRTKSRDVLLPVVLYPVIAPMVIATSLGTAALVDLRPSADTALYWIKFLGFYDFIFIVLGLWIFESLVIE